MTVSLSAKKSFFEALDQLDESDEDADYSFWDHVTKISKTTDVAGINSHTKKVALSLNSRATSDSRSLRDAHANTSRPAILKDPESLGTMPTIKSRGSPPKKTRLNNVKIIPDDQKIFKGLIFCECSICHSHLAFTNPSSQSSFQTTTYLPSGACAFNEHRNMVPGGAELGRMISPM
jgi:hypothetical protein